MLIRFTVENYLSFNQQVELSMIPGLKRKHPDHIFETDTKQKLKLLKSAVVYGANAAGKSNLVKAIAFAKKLILEGTKPNHIINIRKFKLHEESLAKPSRFEFEFIFKGVMYAYGFLINEDSVREEWLYTIDQKDACIFDRKTNKDGSIDFIIGDYFTDADKEFLSANIKATRGNQLLLTEFDNKNLTSMSNKDFLLNPLKWFRENLLIIMPDSRYLDLEYEIKANKKFKMAFNNLLMNFGTGINSIKLKEIQKEEIDSIPEPVLDDIIDDIRKDKGHKKGIGKLVKGRESFLFEKNASGEVKILKLVLLHKSGEKSYSPEFDLEEESDGTQRFFDLIPAFLSVENQDKVIIVDELERSLHPNNTKMFMQLFFNKSVNNKSQLIITTHDVGLLDLEIMRLDELWIVEKDRKGSTKITSLDDFKIRFDKKLQRDYLLGRFGGIPDNRHLITN